jgi:hypothetical protein
MEARMRRRPLGAAGDAPEWALTIARVSALLLAFVLMVKVLSQPEWGPPRPAATAENPAFRVIPRGQLVEEIPMDRARSGPAAARGGLAHG